MYSFLGGCIQTEIFLGTDRYNGISLATCVAR